MNRLLKILLLLYATLVSLQGFSQASKIVSGAANFSVRYIFGTCNGNFDTPKGTAVFNDQNPGASSFNLTIASGTFNTGNNTRDKDMKSEKYFFVAKYPEIRFKSSKIEKTSSHYLATGTITIRDVSKPVALPFQAKKNSEGSYSLTSTFDVNRLDYKLGEKDFKLKDVVTVTLTMVVR